MPCSFPSSSTTSERGSVLFFPVSTCILTLPVPHADPPKSFHNNWTWRQRLEYGIRKRDEKPKVENKKNRTKIRWRERDGGWEGQKLSHSLREEEMELIECSHTACRAFLSHYAKGHLFFFSGLEIRFWSDDVRQKSRWYKTNYGLLLVCNSSGVEWEASVICIDGFPDNARRHCYQNKTFRKLPRWSSG